MNSQTDPTSASGMARPKPPAEAWSIAGTVVQELDGDRPPDAAALSRPDLIDNRYELLEKIAEGGMGAVHRAIDRTLSREVAVKVTRSLNAGPGSLHRFREEARITGQLQHPGIPPVHDLGELPDGRPYLAMKLIRGRTLAAILDELGEPVYAAFLPAFEQVCQAVAYAHSRGVIHRDLKPANIMVGAFGEVQVMDWGLAKVLQADRELADLELPMAGNSATNEPSSSVWDQYPRPDDGSRRPNEWALNPRGSKAAVPVVIADSSGSETLAGSMMGTPAYMPPEQAAGEIGRIDRRSDVFGLGAILCVLLTGRPPYTGADPRRQALDGDLGECWQRLHACRAEGELINLAMRCLSPRHENRPTDAGEVAAAVADFREGVQERARQAELDRVRIHTEQLQARMRDVETKKRRRVQQLLIISMIGLVLVAGTATWYVRLQLANQEQRGQAARSAADDALIQAAELRSRFLWKQAAHALQVSLDQLDAPNAADMRGRLEDAIRETRFLARLDAVRAGSVYVGGVLDRRSAAQEYRMAFRDHGFDLATGNESHWVQLIRESGIRDDIIAALDDWSTIENETALATRLNRIADGADNFALGARTELERQAAQLAENGGSAAQFLRVGLRLERHGGDGVAVLEQGMLWHPGDFWLCRTAGVACLSGAHTNPESAESYLRAAVGVRPDNAPAWTNLGVALLEGHDVPGALIALRRAVELDPQLAGAQVNLGFALRESGRFPEAHVALRRGHELGRQHPHWPHASATWINECERLVELDRRLPALRAGRDRPATPFEAAEFAALCATPSRRSYAFAHRLFGEAFTDPSVIPLFRVKAAASAIQLAVGGDKSMANIEPEEWSHYQHQARIWLGQELAAILRLDRSRSILSDWAQSPAFSYVRDPAYLKVMPDAERWKWEAFWTEVRLNMGKGMP